MVETASTTRINFKITLNESQSQFSDKLTSDNHNYALVNRREGHAIRIENNKQCEFLLIVVLFYFLFIFLDFIIIFLLIFVSRFALNPIYLFSSTNILIFRLLLASSLRDKM